jgi:hypothetical protein
VAPKRCSGSISADDARFASSSSTAFMSFARGFCGSRARIAAARLPTIRPFALRHKQFVSPTLLERAKHFLGSQKSYRQAVRQRKRSLVYDDRQKHPLAAKGAALAHSTLWRWLSWLGQLKRTMQRASQLISQEDPHSTLHRQVISVDPRKYRSQGRRVRLEQAARLLLVEAMFHEHFGKKIFPRFATGCGWR